MQWFMEAAQPYLQTIFLALISLIASLVVAALVGLRKKVQTWVDNKASKEQREILHLLADEAFALVERLYKSEGSQTKLNEAKNYIYSRIKEQGINISDTEIRAVIEKSVLDYNSKINSTQVPQ